MGIEAMPAEALAACRRADPRPSRVYKPRRPQASPLFKLVEDRFTEFHAVYQEQASLVS